MMRGLLVLIDQMIDLATFFGTLHRPIDLGFPAMAFAYQWAALIAITTESAVDHTRRECHSIQ